MRALNPASLVKRDATVSTDPKKPVLLRSVRREPAAASSDTPHEGIQFSSLAERACPYCNQAVSLAGADPLSTVVCPACSGKLMVPGRVGNFLLHDHLGEGEMGAIYRATDESLGREVSVKLVRGCHLDDPESFERLRSEARAAGKLNHPHVAQVYALNFSNGQPYLVMELVTGQDFAQKLEQEQRIDERTALHMALDVADGLSALNREGLVHGDIKPANIVLNREGNAKLVDFGLSGMTRRDGSGALVGTPNYIAPELLRGATDTHLSDIYSLGATLYHLLAGRPPFDGETPQEVVKARMRQLQPTPLGKHARHVSLSTQKLVMRMLEREPEKRQPNSDVVAAEIRESLARLNAATAVQAEDSGSIRRFFGRFSWPRLPHLSVRLPRRRTVVTVILVLTAGTAILIAQRERFFDQTLQRLRQKFASQTITPEKTATQPRVPTAAPVHQKIAERTEAPVLPAIQPPPITGVTPSPDVFTTEASPTWHNMNLGGRTQGGSTMQMSGTMIIQGTGTDMWTGDDSCRLVWTKAPGDYAFSAQIRTIAVNDGFALTGLLAKGADPALGPSVFFGFTGKGVLFLQVRHAQNKTVVVVKRSERSLRIPSYLKLIRRGKAFEACVSADGHAWNRFTACELDLPLASTIGLAVSAQVSNTLATAKFADIRLLTPGPRGAAQSKESTGNTR